mmetsp:Transcript_31153/g.69258  ORF Transcript_31153/g.69258 Transcript_31153/m.69258 type:complete len:91 (+) Transcript_31153:1399-1671(+)
MRLWRIFVQSKIEAGSLSGVRSTQRRAGGMHTHSMGMPNVCGGRDQQAPKVTVHVFWLPVPAVSPISSSWCSSTYSKCTCLASEDFVCAF